MEYVPFEKVCRELEHFFSNHEDPDFVTMSGSGEPTLNSRIGDIISFIKEIRPDIPIAVLTNGTLMHDPRVRQELLYANLVMPSLDAISQPVFEKINRPANGLYADEIIEGLLSFKEIYSGEIWLEIFLLPDYNNHADEIDKMKNVLKRLSPDRVQLNTLDRPGTLRELSPVSKSELENIMTQLDFENIEIISKHVDSVQHSTSHGPAASLILSTISRRPCTIDDLKMITGLHINELNKHLSNLEASGKIEGEKQQRGIFYRTK
jgi:wyosine [tRNA(Phe)-imidazoG37] synthetase (radical SAM superfamily)